MYWTNDYNDLVTEIRTSNEAQTKIVLSAYNKLREFFDHRDTGTEDYIVIQVEGYSCVALITNEFTPIEISPFVVPYDNERIFPLQCIEQKIVFSVDAE